jgi:DNA-binding PucR family transcriptional regulator
VNLDLRLYQELEKALSEIAEKLGSEIITGKAQSFDDYRFRVGRLRGLQDALEVAQEAQKRILSGERK